MQRRPSLARRCYDSEPALRTTERKALAVLARHHARGPQKAGRWPAAAHAALHRLLTPVDDVLRSVGCTRHQRLPAVHLLVQEMHRRQSSLWAWTRDEWLVSLQATDANARNVVMAIAYVLIGHHDLHLDFPQFQRQAFARKVFGRTAVDLAVRRVSTAVENWGYGVKSSEARVPNALCELLIRSGSPRLEDISADVVAAAHRQATTTHVRRGVPLVAHALVALGVMAVSPLPTSISREDWLLGTSAALADVPDEWADWCGRWFRTTTHTRKQSESLYYNLLKTGRWIGSVHPEAANPERWTRATAAEFVSSVDRMLVGEWSHTPSTFRYASRVDLPLRSRTKASQIGAVRTFFRDCHEWGWIQPQFEPRRALTTPRAVLALIGPDPRIIADDVWAKLLWAGLNITSADIPCHGRIGRDSWYPEEMVRAIALIWLFGGLRVDELARLRTGCVRWQRDDVIIAGSTDVLEKDAVCLLDVPAHKTGLPFTKPVDRLVGEAIDAWEAMRPSQPLLLDAKTGEAVDFLFAYRAKRMSRSHVNRCLIPLLCAKANVPRSDARGALTSHRARSTIATQLFNAKEPMTLFELQAWLGHRSPHSTQQYAKIAPTRLAKAYADAGYFGRNLRAVEVLIDQDVVRSGAAARGEPWRFYDLGHGYCTYDFFDQCPHRMACAKCSFYRPKGSSEAQLLEARANLLRLRQDIPLTEDERAAVDDGLVALEHLCAQLANTPTPAGPTPRELAGRGEGKDAFPSPGMVSLPLLREDGS